MWTQGLTELDNNLTLAYIAKKAEKEGFDKLPRERTGPSNRFGS